MRAALAAALLLLSGCTLAPPGTCSSDAQCEKGRSCKNGVCVGCNQDAECRAWESCSVATRTCTLASGRCSAAADCLSWQTCDATNTCALAAGSCVDASGCQEYEECSSHRCVLAAGRCRSDADCSGFWPGCSQAHRCENRPPGGNDLLQVGGIVSTGCDSLAIAPLAAPLEARVGFPCSLQTWSGATLSPDGSVLYTVTDAAAAARWYRFKPDDYIHEGTRWAYPRDPLGNDAPVRAACPPSSAPVFVMQEGTGALLSNCGGAWFQGDASSSVAARRLWAWNASDLLLGEDDAPQSWAVWERASGARHAISGLPTEPFTVVDVRANGDQFRLALIRAVANARSSDVQLWSIDATGVATLVTRYGAEPAGYSLLAPQVIDMTGAAYARGTDPAVSERLRQGVVVRYPPDGAPGEVIRKDVDAPLVRDFAPGHRYLHVVEGGWMIHGP